MKPYTGESHSRDGIKHMTSEPRSIDLSRYPESGWFVRVGRGLYKFYI